MEAGEIKSKDQPCVCTKLQMCLSLLCAEYTLTEELMEIVTLLARHQEPLEKLQFYGHLNVSASNVNACFQLILVLLDSVG